MSKISVLCWWLLCAAAASAQFRIPAARDPLVNDYARMLSDAAETRLRDELRPFRDRGIHVVVLTVSRLRDHGARADSIKKFAEEIYANWGIGNAGENKGALLFFAKDDYKWFLVLGLAYKQFDNAATNNAVRDALNPHFRREDYGEGISAAIRVLKTRVFDAESTSVVPNPGASGGVSPTVPPPPSSGAKNPVDAMIEDEQAHQAGAGYDVERDTSFDVETNGLPPLPGDEVAKPQEAPSSSDPPYVRKEWREPQRTPHHPGFSFGCGSWICWVVGFLILASFFKRRRPPAFGGGVPYRRYGGGGFSIGSAIGGFLLGSLLRGGSRGGFSNRGSSGGGWSGGVGGGGGGGGGFFGGGKSGGGFGGGW